MAKRKCAVLVVGAPRSGTSAVSQLLSDMGVYFGDPADFVDPTVHTHNPNFFELVALNELNAKLLLSIGYDYGHFDYFPGDSHFEPAAEQRRAFEADARHIIRNLLNGKRLVGLKDPRFAFTLPFWTELLDREGYDVKCILTERTLPEIVASNQKVNGKSTAYNTRLALLSRGAAALNLDGRDATVVNFRELLESPQAVASRLALWIDRSALKVPEHSGVDPGLRHEVREDANSPNLDITELSADYRAWLEQLQDSGVLGLLERRREESAELWGKIAELAKYNDEITALRNSRSEEIELISRNNRQDVEHAVNAVRALAEQFEQSGIVALQELNERQKQRISDLEAAVFDLRAQVDDLSIALTAASTQLDGLGEQHAQALSRLEADWTVRHSEIVAELESGHTQLQTELTARNTELQDELKRKAEHAAMVAAQLRSAVDTIAALREETRAAATAHVEYVAGAELDLQMLRDELKHSEQTLQAINSQCLKEKSELLATYQAESEVLRSSLDSFERRNEELAAQLEAAKLAHEGTRAQLQTTSEDLVEMSVTHDAMAHKLQAAIIAQERLTDALSQRIEAQQEAEAAGELLAKEFADQRSEWSTLRDQLESELSYLRGQVAALRNRRWYQRALD